MKRVIKKTIGIFFLIEFIMSVFLSFTELKEHPFIAFFTCVFFGGIAFLLLRHPKNISTITEEVSPQPNGELSEYIQSLNVSDKTTSKDTVDTSSNTIAPTYIETQNIIYRVDCQPISDEEIPYLIELSKQRAMERYEQSENPKFHRSEHEKNLSFQFMMNHSNEIQKHTDSFEECNRLAYSEKNLNKKIELLKETIDLYEKEKKWFYRTKGGMIYFQDSYEHLHNSRNDDFSYIDSIKDYLEDCIETRDYVIPEILNLITSSKGILQKDIYKHLPDVSKSKIQQTIRELETENLITRTKKSSSYFLTIK